MIKAIVLAVSLYLLHGLWWAPTVRRPNTALHGTRPTRSRPLPHSSPLPPAGRKPWLLPAPPVIPSSSHRARRRYAILEAHRDGGGADQGRGKAPSRARPRGGRRQALVGRGGLSGLVRARGLCDSCRGWRGWRGPSIVGRSGPSIGVGGRRTLAGWWCGSGLNRLAVASSSSPSHGSRVSSKGPCKPCKPFLQPPPPPASPAAPPPVPPPRPPWPRVVAGPQHSQVISQ